MPNNEISTYLSDALDQEACKKTLTEALITRVITLQKQGLSNTQIINHLDSLYDNPYQIHDDIIDFVIESLLIDTL